jgi:hypothetical protein
LEASRALLATWSAERERWSAFLARLETLAAACTVGCLARLVPPRATNSATKASATAKFDCLSIAAWSRRRFAPSSAVSLLR